MFFTSTLTQSKPDGVARIWVSALARRRVFTFHDSMLVLEVFATSCGVHTARESVKDSANPSDILHLALSLWTANWGAGAHFPVLQGPHAPVLGNLTDPWTPPLLLLVIHVPGITAIKPAQGFGCRAGNNYSELSAGRRGGRLTRKQCSD